MWVFTRHGMYSVVEDRADKTRVLVRSRERQHLERLIDACGSEQGASYDVIIETPHADYRWRLSMRKSEWSVCLEDLAAEIDYDNFKDEVARRPGLEKYERALHDVWRTMRRLQS